MGGFKVVKRVHLLKLTCNIPITCTHLTEFQFQHQPQVFIPEILALFILIVSFYSSSALLFLHSSCVTRS